jgi:hypothetical protein
MAAVLTIHPDLRALLEPVLHDTGLDRLWDTAEPLPGGRGTARRTVLGGTRFFIKRETRGGLAGRILPPLYLSSDPFRREWAVMLFASRRGLAPRPAAQLLTRRRGLLAAYSLSEAVEAHSLASLLGGTAFREADLADAGRGMGRLHTAGIVHGDMNAGNLLLPVPRGEVVFVDFRHAFVEAGPPDAWLRRANLLRLARSIHKVRRTAAAPPLSRDCWRALAGGYAEAWGGEEAWLDSWTCAASRAYPLRSLLWTGRPS